jgi:Periplasmic copper-binding protein (NosD)
LLSTNGFATPPIALTDCETISQRGNYILNNDLVLKVAPNNNNCLIINSSHVNVDLNGRSITCVQIDGSPCKFGFLGGIGIDIEADHVSIANGGVEGFSYGIVGGADHISATNLALATYTGIALNDASHSVFTDIEYGGLSGGGPFTTGPVVRVSGGGYNTFTSINSPEGSLGGIFIANSSNNIIEGTSILDQEETGIPPGIQLGQESNYNLITNNNIVADFGNGIEVDLGSDYNVIQSNTVEVLDLPGMFAMLDQNPDCGNNVWADNTFSNSLAPGEISASPASCIH